MAQTILITGSSSGIGKATAAYFADHGWNVIATMRSPETATDLAGLANVLCARLDVTDQASITQAIEAGIKRFGRIDAVLNNAGYGAVGVFEAASREDIQKQWDVNVTGVLDVTRAVLPLFRAQGGGMILTVSSMGGRFTFPLYSVYHATKFALEGFMESLLYEVRPQNIRLRLIEPGAIKTDFYGRSMNLFSGSAGLAYQNQVDKAMPRMNQAGSSGASPEAVAAVIFRAATSRSWKLRYPAAGNARALTLLRKLTPDWLFFWIMRTALLR